MKHDPEREASCRRIAFQLASQLHPEREMALMTISYLWELVGWSSGELGAPKRLTTMPIKTTE